jgi:hypothetical protein
MSGKETVTKTTTEKKDGNTQVNEKTTHVDKDKDETVVDNSKQEDNDSGNAVTSSKVTETTTVERK